MEFRHIAHCVSRSARPSLVLTSAQSARSAFILCQQQQQRCQSSSAAAAPAPPSFSSTTSSQPRRPPTPSRLSKPSLLSPSQNNDFLPPRPPRFNSRTPGRFGPGNDSSSSSSKPPPGPRSIPWMVNRDASKAGSSSSASSSNKKNITLAELGFNLPSLPPSPSSSFSPVSLNMWTDDDFHRKHLDRVDNIRLSPSLGRTVYVRGTSSPAQAITQVNRTAISNKLRATSLSQKFHERPALRRKRKLREAWQQRFRKGFSAAVYRAMELRRQGW